MIRSISVAMTCPLVKSRGVVYAYRSRVHAERLKEEADNHPGSFVRLTFETSFAPNSGYKHVRYMRSYALDGSVDVELSVYPDWPPRLLKRPVCCVQHLTKCASTAYAASANN